MDPGPMGSSDDLDSRNLKQMIQVGPLESAVKGGGIFPRNKVPKEPGIGDLVSASNFHESDG